MITPEVITAGAQAAKVNPYWHAYCMVTEKPWPLGFVFWNADQWQRTRDRLGLSKEDVPNLSGELFGHAHLETLAATVNKHYGLN